ncbi:hypothetical protein [Kutzneria sp. NPDC052558]|uniref:hypothetical protein n=1 Tax=Kutzneria sp. NPDC052558 TaxID=3364121 RepID=UPI0037C9775E
MSCPTTSDAADAFLDGVRTAWDTAVVTTIGGTAADIARAEAVRLAEDNGWL